MYHRGEKERNMKGMGSRKEAMYDEEETDYVYGKMLYAFMMSTMCALGT